MGRHFQIVVGDPLVCECLLTRQLQGTAPSGSLNGFGISSGKRGGAHRSFS